MNVHEIESGGFLTCVRMKDLMIDAVAGDMTLADKEMEGLFYCPDGVYLRSIFRRIFVDMVATESTPFAIYNLKKSGTYADLFPSYLNMKKLCLTQHQLINFMTKYASEIVDSDSTTILLYESRGDVYTVKITLRDQDYALMVSLLDLSHYLYFWPQSETCTRFVLPTKDVVRIEKGVTVQKSNSQLERIVE